MNNFNNKSKNNSCPCCGRDFKSHKLGAHIRNTAKELRKQDKEADVLTVLIPLRVLKDEPRNYAILKLLKDWG